MNFVDATLAEATAACGPRRTACGCACRRRRPERLRAPRRQACRAWACGPRRCGRQPAADSPTTVFDASSRGGRAARLRDPAQRARRRQRRWWRASIPACGFSAHERVRLAFDPARVHFFDANDRSRDLIVDRRCAPARLGSDAHYYPWLCDERPIAFRYGDYSALRRRYLRRRLPARRAGWHVSRGGLHRGRMGSARSRSARWISSRKYAARTTSRPSPSRRPGSTATTAPRVLECTRRPMPSCAACATSRSPGMMDDARWRSGYRAPRAPRPALRAAGAVARSSTRQHASRAISRTRTIVLNHAGLPARRRARAAGATAMAELAACSERRGEDLRPRRPVDRGRARWCSRVIELFGTQRGDVREQLSRSTACARASTTIWRTFDDITRGLAPRASAARSSTTMRCASIEWSEYGRQTFLPRLRRRRPDGRTDEQAPGEARLAGHRATTSSPREWPPPRPPARARPIRPPMPRATPTSCCSTCRPTTPSIDAVFGANGVASAVGAKHLVVDFSTIPVDECRRHAARLREATGCRWVDAPVSGGPPASGCWNAHGDGRRRRRRSRAPRAAHEGHRRRAARAWARSARGWRRR